jgi:hypothetical protein
MRIAPEDGADLGQGKSLRIGFFWAVSGRRCLIAEAPPRFPDEDGAKIILDINRITYVLSKYSHVEKVVFF